MQPFSLNLRTPASLMEIEIAVVGWEMSLKSQTNTESKGYSNNNP